MRIKAYATTLLLLLANVTIVLAQSGSPGQPCDGTDPDLVCPLDNWVIILAIAAVAFAAFRLYRKQKSLHA